MNQKINIRFVVLFAIITLVGVWRIVSTSGELSQWSNFSPIGALALFGGCYFMNKTKSYALPLLILLISDMILMQTVYSSFRSGFLYENWYWTYGSFAAMVFFGEILLKKVSVTSVLVASFAAGLVHFFITNFGVWMAGGTNLLTGLPYARDWSGLVNCYLAAIPYFKNMVLGNVLFGSILFGGFELAQRRFSVLRVSTSAA